MQLPRQWYPRARFAIRAGTDIIEKLQDFRSFLDIYDLPRAIH
jgi:hypothetical protein